MLHPISPRETSFSPPANKQISFWLLMDIDYSRPPVL